MLQTEKDFADIAAAGLNFVRIPIPYWAIETRENEPFLAKTSWTYVYARRFSKCHLTNAAVLSQILPEGCSVGPQVRPSYQPRLACPAWFSERLEPLQTSRHH